MRIGDIAGAIGKGFVAGAIGTAAMTVSSTIEMKLRKREASTAPADAAAKVLGVHPDDEKDVARFSNFVHWSYGTSWGGVRGVLGALGLSGAIAGAAHFATVWGNELIMLPKLKVAPPLREWEAKDLGIDAFHHAVYATATSLAFEYLHGHSTKM